MSYNPVQNPFIEANKKDNKMSNTLLNKGNFEEDKNNFDYKKIFNTDNNLINNRDINNNNEDEENKEEEKENNNEDNGMKENNII